MDQRESAPAPNEYGSEQELGGPEPFLAETWVECFDSVSQCSYFVDKNDPKRSTWTRPLHGDIIPYALLEAHETHHAAAAEQNATSMSLGPAAKELANTWVQLYDANEDLFYYANALSKRTTWTRPLGETVVIVPSDAIHGARSPSASADGAYGGESPHNAVTETYRPLEGDEYESYDMEDYDHFGDYEEVGEFDSDEDVATVLSEATRGDMVPGASKVNVDDGIVSGERPPQPSQHGRVSQVRASHATELGSRGVAAQRTFAIPREIETTPVSQSSPGPSHQASQRNSSSGRRPSRWREKIDSISNQKYYLDEDTGVTTWIDPADSDPLHQTSDDNVPGVPSATAGSPANINSPSSVGGREEIWEVDVGDLDGTLVKDISEIKDFGIASLGKYMKTAVVLLRKGRGYNLQKVLRSIIEIAERPQEDTWGKIKSPMFIRWLLSVLANSSINIAWPDVLQLLYIMSKRPDSRYLLVRESRLWDMMFKKFLGNSSTTVSRHVMGQCLFYVLKMLRHFLKEDYEIFCFFVYQSDGVGLFLNIQKRYASAAMTRVVEHVLLHAFKGPVRQNSLLMRMSATRLYSVLQSNMIRLVPKVLKALKYRLEMYHRPIFSSLVVSQQTMTSFSSLDFGATWNRRHIVLSPQGYLFEYEIESEGQKAYVAADACAVFKVNLKYAAATEIAINRINNIHHYGLQLVSLDSASDRVYTLAIARSSQLQEWLHICQEMSRTNWRLSASSSYNRGVLLANAHVANALAATTTLGGSGAAPLSPAHFFIRPLPATPSPQRRNSDMEKGRWSSSAASESESDDSSEQEHYFNLDEYQAINPESFDRDVARRNAHGGSFVDLLCTYADIVDASSAHECETAMISFEILLLYLSGHSASKYCEKILTRGIEMIPKVFRAINAALQMLGQRPHNHDKVHTVSLEHMGSILYPLDINAVSDGDDSDPNDVTWEVDLDENLAQDLGIGEGPSSQSRSEDKAPPHEDVGAGNFFPRHSPLGRRVFSVQKQSRRSDASDCSLPSDPGHLDESGAVGIPHFLASASIRLLVGLLLPNYKDITLTRLTPGNCATLVKLLRCEDFDIVTLACHVLQFCVSSTSQAGNAVRKTIFNSGFVAALSNLQFPADLSLSDNALASQHSMSSTSSFLSVASSENEFSTAASRRGLSQPTLRAKIRNFQITLLQRNLAIIVLVSQHRRLLYAHPTTLSLVVESRLAPAVLVALQVMLSRCSSHSNPEHTEKFLEISVPKLVGLLNSSISAFGDPSISQTRSETAEPVIPLLEKKIRFNAIAVLLSFVVQASNTQRESYCNSGIIFTLVKLIAQEAVMCDDTHIPMAGLSFEQRLISRGLSQITSFDEQAAAVLRMSFISCELDSYKHIVSMAGLALLILLHGHHHRIRTHLVSPGGNILLFELLHCVQSAVLAPTAKTVIIYVLLCAVLPKAVDNKRIIGDIGGVEVLFSVLVDAPTPSLAAGPIPKPLSDRIARSFSSGISGSDSANSSASKNKIRRSRSAATGSSGFNTSSTARNPHPASERQNSAKVLVRTAAIILLRELCLGCPNNTRRACTRNHIESLFTTTKIGAPLEAEVVLRLIISLFSGSTTESFSCDYGRFLIGNNPNPGSTVSSSSLYSSPNISRQTAASRRRRKSSHPDLEEYASASDSVCATLPLIVALANSSNAGLASAARMHLQHLGSLHYYLHGYGRSPAGTKFVLFSASDLHSLICAAEHVRSPQIARQVLDSPARAMSLSQSAPANEVLSHREGDPSLLSSARKRALFTLLLRHAIGQWPSLETVLESGQASTELRLSILGRGNQFCAWRTLRFVLKLVHIDGLPPLLMLYGYRRKPQAQHLRRTRLHRARHLHYASPNKVPSAGDPATFEATTKIFAEENLDPVFKLLVHCPAFGVRCEIQSRASVSRLIGCHSLSGCPQHGPGRRPSCTCPLTCACKHYQRQQQRLTVENVMLLKIDRFICNDKVAYAQIHPQFRNFVFAFQAATPAILKAWLGDPRWRYCIRNDVDPARAEYFRMLDTKFCSSVSSGRRRADQDVESSDATNATHASSERQFSAVSSVNVASRANESNNSDSMYSSDSENGHTGHSLLGIQRLASGPLTVDTLEYTDEDSDFSRNTGTDSIPVSVVDDVQHEVDRGVDGETNAFVSNTTSKTVRHTLYLMRANFFNFEWSVQSALSVGRSKTPPTATNDRNGSFGGTSGTHEHGSSVAPTPWELTEFSLRPLSDYAFLWSSINAQQFSDLLQLVSWKLDTTALLLIAELVSLILSHLPERIEEDSTEVAAANIRATISAESHTLTNYLDEGDANTHESSASENEFLPFDQRHSANMPSAAASGSSTPRSCGSEESEHFRSPATEISVGPSDGGNDFYAPLVMPLLHHRLKWLERFNMGDLVASHLNMLKILHWRGDSPDIAEERHSILARSACHDLCAVPIIVPGERTKRPRDSSPCPLEFHPPPLQMQGEVRQQTTDRDDVFPPGMCFELRIPIREGDFSNSDIPEKMAALFLVRHASGSNNSSCENNYWGIKDIVKVRTFLTGSKSDDVHVADRLLRIGRFSVTNEHSFCEVRQMWVDAYGEQRAKFNQMAKLPASHPKRDILHGTYLSLILVRESSSSVTTKSPSKSHRRILRQRISTQQRLLRTLSQLSSCVFVDRDVGMLRYYYEMYEQCRHFLLEHECSTKYIVSLCRAPCQAFIEQDSDGEAGVLTSRAQMSTVLSALTFISNMCANTDAGAYEVLSTDSVDAIACDTVSGERQRTSPQTGRRSTKSRSNSRRSVSKRKSRRSLRSSSSKAPRNLFTPSSTVSDGASVATDATSPRSTGSSTSSISRMSSTTSRGTELFLEDIEHLLQNSKMTADLIESFVNASLISDVGVSLLDWIEGKPVDSRAETAFESDARRKCMMQLCQLYYFLSKFSSDSTKSKMSGQGFLHQLQRLRNVNHMRPADESSVQLAADIDAFVARFSEVEAVGINADCALKDQVSKYEIVVTGALNYFFSGDTQSLKLSFRDGLDLLKLGLEVSASWSRCYFQQSGDALIYIDDYVVEVLELITSEKRNYLFQDLRGNDLESFTVVRQTVLFVKELFVYLVAHCSYFHLEYGVSGVSLPGHSAGHAPPASLPIMNATAKRTFEKVHRMCCSAASMIRNLSLQGRSVCKVLRELDIRDICFGILKFSAVRDGAMSEDALFALYGVYVVDEQDHENLLQRISIPTLPAGPVSGFGQAKSGSNSVYQQQSSQPQPAVTSHSPQTLFSSVSLDVLTLFLSVTASVSPGVMELSAQIFERLVATVGAQYLKETQNTPVANDAAAVLSKQLRAIAKRLVGWLYFVPVAHLRAQHAQRSEGSSSSQNTNNIFERYANAISSICAALSVICTIHQSFIDFMASMPGFFERLGSLLQLHGDGGNLSTHSTGGIYEQVCRLMDALLASTRLRLPRRDLSRAHTIAIVNRLRLIAASQGPGSVRDAVVGLLLSMMGLQVPGSASSEASSADISVAKAILGSLNFEQLIGMTQLVTVRECRVVVWQASVQVANRLEWEVQPTAATMPLVDKSGWLLRKRSTQIIIGPRWIRRWFALCTPHLFEFQGNSGKKGTVVKRKVMLQGCSVRKVNSGGKQALRLRLPDDGGDIFLCRADTGNGTSEQLDDWFDEIRDAVMRSNEIAGPPQVQRDTSVHDQSTSEHQNQHFGPRHPSTDRNGPHSRLSRRHPTFGEPASASRDDDRGEEKLTSTSAGTFQLSNPQLSTAATADPDTSVNGGSKSHALQTPSALVGPISPQEFIHSGFDKFILRVVGCLAGRVAGVGDQPDEVSALIALHAARILATLLPQLVDFRSNTSGSTPGQLATACAVAAALAQTVFSGHHGPTVNQQSEYQLKTDRIRILHAFSIARLHVPRDFLLVHNVNCLFPYFDLNVAHVDDVGEVRCNMCQHAFTNFASRSDESPDGAGYLLPPCPCFEPHFRIKSNCAQCSSKFDARNPKVPCSYCKSACCTTCCAFSVLQLREDVLNVAQRGGEVPNDNESTFGVPSSTSLQVCAHCYKVSRHIKYPSLNLFRHTGLSRTYFEELRPHHKQ